MNYIFLADGFEEIEGLMVVDLLRRADIDITMVSMSEKKQVTGAHGISVTGDAIFQEIDFSNKDMLILPGGMPGTTNLMEHKELVQLLIDHNEEGKMIGAICAAPSVLGVNKILEGKHATCFPGFEEKLLGAAYLDEKVVKDKNIITSKGLGTALDFALAMIEHYKGSKVAKEIKYSVQYY